MPYSSKGRQLDPLCRYAIAPGCIFFFFAYPSPSPSCSIVLHRAYLDPISTTKKECKAETEFRRATAEQSLVFAVACRLCMPGLNKDVLLLPYFRIVIEML